MNEVLRMSRKTLTAAVVAATIAWSIGLSALVAPLTARAATPASGSLVKASLPAVYYVGADAKRYVFPNEKTYKTWYVDFSGVMTITDAELAALPIGGNVTYRPGVKLVKIQTDPKTYAVAKNGTLRWVKSEALATSLYGSDWNTADTHDVPDAFFTNYTLGADINNASDYSPAGEMSQATSINADKNLGGTVTGSLSAMLSSGQPAGGTIPKGANGVNVLKMDVRNNSSSSMTVDSLTAHRSGAGVTGDISAMYVYSGNDRLTTGRTFNSTTHDASFSGLNLTLAAGESKTLWLAVDFSATAGSANQHSFSVTALLSGSTGASGLPLSGPTFTISGATAGSVTIAKSGSVTNPKAGQMAAKVAEFQLTAGSVEDIDLSKIALYQGGSVSRDKFSNLSLKQAGTTLASTSALNSKDLAVFALATPMLIEKGNSKTFEVYADIAASARSAETVKFWLDQTTDLLAVGRTYGYGVAVTNTLYDGGTCTSSAGDCSYSSVDAGQLTITFNGPAAKDIASNGKDVELFNFTMAAQANLEVRKLQLVLDGNGDLDDGAAVPRVLDIKLVDTSSGATVMGPKDSTNGTGYATGNNSATLDFSEVFNLSANQARTFKVTADIGNDATLTGGENLSTLKVTLKKFSALSSAVRNLDNSTDLTAADYVPDADIAGNTHTIKSPSLALTLASTPVAQTYIQGSQGIELAGLNLKAGDASDVRVNSLVVKCEVDAHRNNGVTNAGGGDFAQGQDDDADSDGGGANVAESKKCTDILQLAKLWNGTTQVSTSKSPSSSTGVGTGGVLTFDNMNLTIAKGQTVTLKLTGNLSNSITLLEDRVQFRTDETAGDVSATDVDGNSIDPTGGALVSNIMTIAAAGTITVALAPDDSESEAGHLVGGTTNAVLAKYKLTAANEELKLTKARFNVATPNTTASLSLYDGATLVGGPVSVDGSGNADFSSMNFVIPKDGTKNLTVKGNLNTVGSSGAASGATATVTLKDTAGTFEVRGTSAGSSTTITSTGSGDVAGKQKVVRRTKPTISLVALPTTALSNAGGVVIARFTVSADSAENVAIKKISFRATVSDTGSDGAFSAIALREVGQGSDLAGTASALETGSECGFASSTTDHCIRVQLTNEYVVSAGTSKTLELRATTAGFANAGDTSSVSLLGDAALATGEMDQVTAAPGAGIDDYDGTANNGEYNFLWSDNSKVPHNDVVAANAPGTDAAGSSNDWTNGLYVKVLPADPQTMTKT